MLFINTLPIILSLPHSVILTGNFLAYYSLYSNEYHAILNNTHKQKSIVKCRCFGVKCRSVRLKGRGLPCEMQGRRSERQWNNL